MAQYILNHVVYKLNQKKKTASVLKLETDYPSDINIPGFVKIDGIVYIVNKIEDHAFQYANIDNVFIPAGITLIEEAAFYASKIKKLYRYPSVYKLTIKNGAFADCGFLKSVTLNGVTELYHGAFSEARDIQEIDSIHIEGTLPDYVFSGVNLKEFTFSDRIFKIKKEAFLNASLENIYFVDTPQFDLTDELLNLFKNATLHTRNNNSTIKDLAYDGYNVVVDLREGSFQYTQ